MRIINKSSAIFFFLFICFVTSLAQTSTFVYQNADNKYYWKNRKPYEGYWQQDVYYQINASLDDKTDIIDGSEELTYFNNSPDELKFVYFHLYSNAQSKCSYLADLYKNNGTIVKFGKYSEQGLGTNVSKITSENVELKTEVDNTIMKVYLSKPLKTGERITFNIDFKTYFNGGTLRNRMKLFKDEWGNKHYDVVHWYPRICVYDRKQGWDTDQHMDHEFYGDFGVYDVHFTLPNNYIADATGLLINRDEVLPADLRDKLNIKNFAKKPLGEKPSEIIAADGTTKKWKFHAENVHDFALTADPTYRIGESEWNGIKTIALAQEPHASRWQNAADYAAMVIKINSESWGMYAYPKMIVADAQDGMEYPMLTLDGGLEPEYRDVLAHEISHNWFFGMVGSNETYRAALDEGFTQFTTCWDYERINGPERLRYEYKSKYVEYFSEPDFVRNSQVYNGYMNEAARGIETFMSLHSDMYGGSTGKGGGYRQVYSKTATMLFNLQYTLGDSVFLAAMNHYFNQWKMCHPYIEDFRNSIIQYTHVDLNWFFDEWMETPKTIDYSIKSVKPKKGDTYEITFKRKGMQMPIDFTVIDKADSVHNYHIPNNWYVKPTSAKVLPRWIGWDNVKKTYTATVSIPEGINDVLIDPTHRLADVNMLNNSKNFPVKFRFDSKIPHSSDWTKYEMYIRPDVWYNGYDGLKVGLNLNGNYFNYKHIFDATVWFSTSQGQNFLDTSIINNHQRYQHDIINFRINYRTSTDRFMKGSSVYLSAKSLDGLNAYSLGFDRKDVTGKNKVYMYLKSMYRLDTTDLHYLLLPKEWVPNMLNNTVNIGFEHNYTYRKGTGNINIGLRSSALQSDYDYQSVNLTMINRTNIWRLKLNTRVYGQYGTGKNWADESSLFLSGANPEEMMDNKYTRSLGFFDPKWSEYGASTNYFNYGGGLNLRGYSGYLAPQLTSDGSVVYTYKGHTGAAINGELEFDGIIKIKKQIWLTRTFKLTTYFFGDAGFINYNAPTDNIVKMADLRADAGVGATITIKKFWVLQGINPLVIRFDMPLFLSNLPATNKDYFMYRFVVGVSRAF